MAFPYALDFPDGPLTATGSPVCKVPLFTCGFVSAAIPLGIISCVFLGFFLYASFLCGRRCLGKGEEESVEAAMGLVEEEIDESNREPLIAHV